MLVKKVFAVKHQLGMGPERKTEGFSLEHRAFLESFRVAVHVDSVPFQPGINRLKPVSIRGAP